MSTYSPYLGIQALGDVVQHGIANFQPLVTPKPPAVGKTFRHVAPAISLVLLLTIGDGLMHKIAQVLMAALMCMVATAAQCESWVFMGKNTDGYNFIDFETIKPDKSRSGNQMKIWMKTIKETPKKAPNTILITKTLVRFDCEDEKLALLSTVNYGAGGKVISSASGNNASTPVIPGSIGDDLMKHACHENVRMETLRAWVNFHQENKMEVAGLQGWIIIVDGEIVTIDKSWSEAQIDAAAQIAMQAQRARRAQAASKPSAVNSSGETTTEETTRIFVDDTPYTVPKSWTDEQVGQYAAGIKAKNRAAKRQQAAN